MILMILMSWFNILKDGDHGLPAKSHPPKISPRLKIVIDEDPGILKSANQLLIRVIRFEREDQKSLEQHIIKKPLNLNSVLKNVIFKKII